MRYSTLGAYTTEENVYNKEKFYTMQRISVVLRRTTSRTLMGLERRAKAYPSVALGAAPQP